LFYQLSPVTILRTHEGISLGRKEARDAGEEIHGLERVMKLASGKGRSNHLLN